jgi:cell division protein FtsZ
MTTISTANHSDLIELRPKITVVGVGGAGGNAVNNMINANLQGVEFVVCNTDAQALGQALAEQRIQLGHRVTQGLGAGSRPEVGRAAAEESMEQILNSIKGSNMVFVTAGMGGGTGTGGAPVVAQAAREQGILTVAVVTKPFHFEGKHRMRTAENGIEELEQYVDTLIIIPNQNLFRIANDKTTFSDAFRLADEVLHSGVRGVTDLMIMPGLINLDFADIRAVMMEMGKAMMGTGEGAGEGRAIAAAEAAISNPLLEDVTMKGARGVLINITGGMDMTLFEVDEAANRVREEVDPDANIIFGSTFDEKMQGRIRVSVVATGIEQEGRQNKTKTPDMSGLNLPESAATERSNIQPRGFFTRKREEESKANGEEKNDIFSAAYKDPSENATELKAVNKSFSEGETSSEDNSLPDGKEDELDLPFSEQPHANKARKLSFFERVAETMRGANRSNFEEQPPLNSASEEEASAGVKVYTNVKERQNAYEQDTLEIPAFLRRRVK